VLGVVNLVSASQLVPVASRVRTVDAPFLGDLRVTDGRTLLERRVDVALDDGDRFPARFRDLQAQLADLASAMRAKAGASGQPAIVLIQGGGNQLVNTNSLGLISRLADNEDLITGALVLPDPLSESAVAAAVDDPARGLPNFLITFPPTGSAGGSTLLARLLTGDGFVPFRTDTMPDGRVINVWWRSQADAPPFPRP
jgi:hypothetical protein